MLLIFSNDLPTRAIVTSQSNTHLPTRMVVHLNTAWPAFSSNEAEQKQYIQVKTHIFRSKGSSAPSCIRSHESDLFTLSLFATRASRSGLGTAFCHTKGADLGDQVIFL